MDARDLEFIDTLSMEARIRTLRYAGVKFVKKMAPWDHMCMGPDVEIAAGTLIWPNVVLLGNTKIGENCEIGPDITLEDTTVGNNTKIKRGCNISHSRIGDNCVIWVHVSMLHAEVKERVIVHRDTRLVWTKIGARTDLEASSQIKYANIGEDCRICHSIIEGDKFDDETLLAGKRTVLIGDSCSIGPGAYMYGKVIVNPQARISQADITNSFIGKRTRAYRCRISDSKILHDCVIEEGAYIRDSIVNPYCEIARCEVGSQKVLRNKKLSPEP